MQVTEKLFNGAIHIIPDATPCKGFNVYITPSNSTDSAALSGDYLIDEDSVRALLVDCGFDGYLDLSATCAASLIDIPESKLERIYGFGRKPRLLPR